MLLPTHFRIFVEALKKIGFVLENDVLKSPSQQKPSIQLNDEAIRKFSKGIFFPDLPCAFFYLDRGELEMFIKLCSGTKLATLGKFTNDTVSSQMEESHNGKFSLNHSMASNNYETNEEVRLEIVRRCCIIAYKFLSTRDYTYLGYLIHIIQDSYSPGHTYREFLEKKPAQIEANFASIITDLNKYGTHKYKIPSEINAKTINNLAYVMLSGGSNIKQILDETDKILSLKKPKEDVDYSQLFNLIIVLLMNTVDAVEKEVSDPSMIKKKLLKILIDDSDKKIINKDYVEKTLMSSKIKYDKIIENKYKGIFQLGLTYNLFPHNLTRLYKLVMNYLFTHYIVKKIEMLKGGSSDANKFPYVRLFLFYPNQNAVKHGVKDCRGILQKDFGDKKLYDWAVYDTAHIMKLMLFSTGARQGIINLYNHLMNHTYYISPEYLKLVGNKSNPIVQTIYNKIEANEKKLYTTRVAFLKCTKENVALAASGFSCGMKQIKPIYDAQMGEDDDDDQSTTASPVAIDHEDYKLKYENAMKQIDELKKQLHQKHK